jgi:Flp pilus assembly protein TadD
MSDAPAAGPEAPRGEGRSAFEEGLSRYAQGDAEGAHPLFQRAHRRSPSDPRVTSWYGLTLVLVERNSSLGVLYCDQAVRTAGPDPELLLNQARAHMALGQRERAVRAVQRGLEASPDHPGLRAAQEAMGWRRRPALPFLARDNPLNRWLGRLRHRWSRRSRPAPDCTPMRLGIVEEREPAKD